MESLQMIKNRIGSIASTRQITQSMRLVSTSKAQRARAGMEANRPFLQGTEQLLRAAAKELEGFSHPYLKGRERRRAAVVVIAGDRGLCGGYNINANRRAAELIRSLECEVQLITVGIKARDFCRRRYKDGLKQSFTGVSENPYSEDVAEIARLAKDWYDHGEVDEIYVVYTRFESMLVQTPAVRRLLPLEIPPEEEAPVGTAPLVRCEPGGRAFLEQLAPFFLSACLLGAILESLACEQSARITSMDAAVKNADEMIESLTLRYNRARQDTITQEIIEIVGGAGAV